MNYFTHQKLSEYLYRITDFTGVCCYLVVGREKACLLDTCGGIGDIKEYIGQITKLPTFVILTHGHLDHIGGAGLFDEVYMNKNDLPVFKKHGDMQFRIEDTNNHIPVNMRKIDEKEFILTYSGKIKTIEDGDIFDLGDVRIKMILVKGHTQGMMCPLIIEDRSIVFGDACGVGVLLFDEYSSSVSEYRESLINLKKYENEYDTIYRNHGTFSSEKVLLDNVIECCDLILSERDDKIPVSFHGVNLFACKQPRDDGHGRLDGVEGNILYSIDKVS